MLILALLIKLFVWIYKHLGGRGSCTFLQEPGRRGPIPPPPLHLIRVTWEWKSVHLLLRRDRECAGCRGEMNARARRRLVWWWSGAGETPSPIWGVFHHLNSAWANKRGRLLPFEIAVKKKNKRESQALSRAGAHGVGSIHRPVRSPRRRRWCLGHRVLLCLFGSFVKCWMV